MLHSPRQCIDTSWSARPHYTMWPKTRPATERMQSVYLQMGWFTQRSRSQAPVCKLLSSSYVIDSNYLYIRLQWANLHAEFSSHAANAALWFCAVPGRDRRWQMPYGSHGYQCSTRYDLFHVEFWVKTKAYEFRYSHPIRASTMERGRVSLLPATFKSYGNRKWVSRQPTGVERADINDL